MSAAEPAGYRVAVVGAGLVGRSWAIVFARAGWNVKLYDRDETVRREAGAKIGASLKELSAAGLCDRPADALRHVAVCDTLAETVADAELVQESLPEMVGMKREMFAELDRLAPGDAILASSTSAIVASRFTESLAGRHRCLVAHPVNPPHLVPLVELCPAPWTDAEVVDRAKRFYEAAGQVPILVRKEMDGFVLNRLQGALLTEALRLVADGVATPQDVDRTIRDGLGLRWSFMGPFETIELNAPGGIGDYAQRYGPFYAQIAAAPPSPDVWSAAAVAKVLAAWRAPSPEARTEKAEWRDRRLAAMAAFRRGAQDWSGD